MSKINIDKDTAFKAVAWIGAVLVVYAIILENSIAPYLLETAGVFYVLGYAYQKFASKVALLAITVFFVIVYALVTFSPADLIWWAVVLVLQL